MKAIYAFSLLLTALILGACYVDVYEPGTSSSAYYSEAYSSSYSSSSRVVVQQDSLEYENEKYKTVKLGSQIWIVENLNAIPSKGNWWCHGNFDERCKEYGRLYDWEAAMSVCPDGWKLPSKDDFDNLLSDYGDLLNSVIGWNAAFGGLRYEDDSGFTYEFEASGGKGYYWSSTGSGKQAYYVSVEKNVNNLTRELANKARGFSVRCVKNASN